MSRVLMLGVIAALALAACGSDGGSGAGGASGPITVQLTADPVETKLWNEVVAAYKKATGGTVRLVPIGDRQAHLSKLATSIAARRPPDAFLINYRNAGGFAARGSIVPAEQPAGDFYEIALEAFTLEGKLQCVPQNASSLVVYYNRELFAAAGLPLPRRDWSYDDFVAAAKALTKGGVHGVGLEPNAIRASAFVWGGGGELTDDPNRPTRFTLDTPGARRGLEAMLRLHREGLTPSAEESESESLDEQFIAGKLGMFLSSRREVPTFRTIEAFEWDVAGFPVIERPATVLHSDGWCIAKGANAAAARAWVRFAAGPDGQRILARGGRTVPSLKAVAQSPDYLDPGAPPQSSDVFLAQIDVMRRLPLTRNWTAIEEAVDLALEQAFYGRISLDAAIERIGSETSGRF